MKHTNVRLEGKNLSCISIVSSPHINKLPRIRRGCPDGVVSEKTRVRILLGSRIFFHFEFRVVCRKPLVIYLLISIVPTDVISVNERSREQGYFKRLTVLQCLYHSTSVFPVYSSPSRQCRQCMSQYLQT